MIEMNIKGLAVDPLTNVPIVILEEVDGDRVLPIWVGLFEAHAIAREMENFEIFCELSSAEIIVPLE